MVDTERASEVSNPLPRCFNNFVLKGDHEVTINPANFSMFSRGACLGRHQELGAEADKFACVLGEVTLEEAERPEELRGISKTVRFSGPTCKEYMMAVAGTLDEQIKEARHA
jgi:hypothetical protein